jgi:hypothetical protein
LAQRSASSSSLKRCTVMTGPKISFWIASSSCRRPSTTVGCRKNPSPRPSTRLPPAVTLACWAAGRGTRDPLELAGVVHRAQQRVVVVLHPDLGVLPWSERAATKSSARRVRQAPGGRGAVLPGVEVAGDRDGLPRRPRCRVVETTKGPSAELEVNALDGSSAADAPPACRRAPSR